MESGEKFLSKVSRHPPDASGPEIHPMGVITLKNASKRIIGWLLVAYILWLAYNVVYGIVLQVTWFCSDDFLPESFRAMIYLYIGSWFTMLAFLLSGFFCLRACLSSARCGLNLILSGAFGLTGYLIGYVTDSIHRGSPQLPGIYALTSASVLALGLLSRNRSPENPVYIPALCREPGALRRSFSPARLQAFFSRRRKY